LYKPYTLHSGVSIITKTYDIVRAKGDLDGQQVWIKIMKAVDELLAETVPKGTSVH